ncbi:hypothetical protein MtrunA17_Chr7g0253061 [Medicago truncatula]|uniref:Uncharacterized protein n=1 Tax=Medicago truncatula TaxID=3880 RepID=A0A396H6U3_MEDTR|nr:hypothetical protein MtrunA17_Chr7g0253061 [Medicago truncatula]
MSTHNQNFTSIDPLFTKNYYLFIGKGYKLSYGAVEFRIWFPMNSYIFSCKDVGTPLLS